MSAQFQNLNRYFSRKATRYFWKVIDNNSTTPELDSARAGSYRYVRPSLLAAESTNTCFVPDPVTIRANNKRLSSIVSRCASKNLRHKYREVLLEGRRLIADSLAAGVVLKCGFVCELYDKDIFGSNPAPIHFVSKTQMNLLSQVDTPPGVIAIFKMPHETCLISRCSVLPLTLIADNIRDPGNMGTIIRLAAATQCHELLLSKGCVDIWEPKVLRSAMGSHFRIPLYNNLTWENIRNRLPVDTQVFLADIQRAPSQTSDKQDPNTQCIHNETYPNRYASNTLSTNYLNNYSVNRKSQQINVVTTSEASANRPTDPVVNTASQITYQRKITELLDTSTCRPDDAHVRLYYDVNFTSGHHTIVLCNESHGPSDDARKLVFNMNGETITIPTEGVESLNSAMATAVLLFEAKRQIVTKNRNTLYTRKER